MKTFFDRYFWQGFTYTVTGVFLGAVLTWTVSTHVENSRYQKDQQQRIELQEREKQQYIELLKIELQKNLEAVQIHKQYYKSGSKFLPNYFGYEKSAFEMFKNSGRMSLLKNRGLLSSVWKIYTRLEQLKEMNASYIQSQMDKGWLEMDIKSIRQSFQSVDDLIQQVLNDYNKL
jgi:putative NADPH-quinone reductase